MTNDRAAGHAAALEALASSATDEVSRRVAAEAAAFLRASVLLPTPDQRRRHVKTGGSYDVLCRTGRLQTKAPIGDMTTLVSYRGEDGEWWHRPVDEFEDGRFAEAG